jgi:toxin ParE1/3/4
MIIRRPAFLDALIEQATYIGQDSLSAAERFIDAVESTFAQLETRPALGRAYETHNPRLTGIRVLRVKGFHNYLIFYRPHPKGIEAIHVLHGARDIPEVLERDL